MSSTLLDQISTAVADEYAVLGQLGDSARGSAFLARERAGGHLVVLTVPPAADELSVLAAVGDEVPANAGACTACGSRPPTFTPSCPTCGRAFVLSAVDAHRFTPAEVDAAATHAYDVLGEVAHQAGGSLFFVRDRADGRLVALAAQADGRGGQSLEAVWDAVQGDRTAVSQPPAPFDPVPPATHESYGSTGGFAPAFPPPAVAEEGGPGAFDADQPPGYPPEYREPALAEASDVGRPRRRWVPLAAAAAVVLAAGGAWAAMHNAQPAPAPAPLPVPPAPTPPAGPPAPVDSQRPPAGADPSPVGPTARDVAPAVANDSAALAAREARRQADSAARALAAPATVTLEGSLPSGWTWTVNGRRGPSSLTTRLRPNRPATLSVEAPGYCPEVLQIAAPAPGSAQRWAPRLRGKPMVGDC